MGEAEYATQLPMPALRPYVGRYVGYRMRGFEPGIHRGLPSRHLTFIVTFDALLELAGMPGASQPPGRFAAMVSGYHAAPALLRHDGNQHGVQLFVTPLGARTLLRTPSSALVGQVVHLDDVLGHLAHELVDRLSSVSGWSARFAVLDRVLFGALRPTRGLLPEVAATLRGLIASGGNLEIARIASEVGWSRRHLSERFREETGLPPKVMARILRFERAKAMLTAPSRTRLADIATHCGYADQAHLTREWRAMAGLSPSSWLREEKLPFFQDEEGAQDAPSGP
jgi:AraC-like DNA-binding protein